MSCAATVKLQIYEGRCLKKARYVLEIMGLIPEQEM
mgnify:CR=1 FL=1